MSSQPDDEPSGMIRFRNSLVCVPCRSRHVKCDATKPGCNRCRIDGKTCYFVKSRRGMRSKQGSENSTTSIISDSTISFSSPNNFRASITPSFGSGSPNAPPFTPTSTPSLPTYHTSQLPTSSPFTLNKPENESEILLNLYYTFFHNAHPWLLPYNRLQSLIKSNMSQVQGLLTVMEFIGSTYTPDGQCLFLRQRALNTLSEPDIPRNGYTVQALLILAVGVHSCTDFQLARDMLDKAISIALEIGMHYKHFALTNGDGDSVLEESWRRTWWGLFVIDGSIEAIRRTWNFKTWYVHSNVDLPCEESDYRREKIPTPQTLQEYAERDLAEIEVSFSSFAYLIDVLRILGSLMAATTSSDDIPDSIIDATDRDLVNWKLHLPECKKDILKTNGEIDEPLFQAHMDFNVVQVHLHRKRSRLIHSPVESTAKCAPSPPPSDIPQARRQVYWISTQKAMNAAEQAINIFTLPTPLAKHTPMVICGVVLSVLAELSACSYVLEGSEYEASRNRIRLGIGTLKEYGKIWPVGRQSLIEVKSIAREVFSTAATRKSLSLASDPGPESNPLDDIDPSHIQTFFDEFGALEYISLLNYPVSS